jgi:hypothetical protein
LLLSKHLEHKFQKTTIGKDFMILEVSYEECTFEEDPTFAPPSSSIKCSIKNPTKLKYLCKHYISRNARIYIFSHIIKLGISSLSTF